MPFVSWLHRLIVQHLAVADVVAVVVLAVAVDDDAEDVLYGILVAIEGSTGKGQPSADFGLHPLLVDLD